MKELLYVTGNTEKVGVANSFCAPHQIKLIQLQLDIDEIQGEDSEIISLDKARKAFAEIGKPLVISDDSWSITGLNGFPGPYMKSILQ